MHAVVPNVRLLYTPAVQSAHTVGAVALNTLLYLPAVHAVQLDAPVVSVE